VNGRRVGEGREEENEGQEEEGRGREEGGYLVNTKDFQDVTQKTHVLKSVEGLYQYFCVAVFVAQLAIFFS
jgi:hypothetical protein